MERAEYRKLIDDHRAAESPALAKMKELAHQAALFQMCRDGLDGADGMAVYEALADGDFATAERALPGVAKQAFIAQKAEILEAFLGLAVKALDDAVYALNTQFGGK